jgi:hypothetical protein
VASAPENTAQAPNQDIGVQTTDSRDAEESSRSYNDRLTQLKRDLELLTEAVQATPPENATNAPDTKALERFRWDIDGSLEVRKLHASFIQLTKQLGTKVQTLADQNRNYQIVLAEKEKDLQATREPERAPDPSLADHRIWEKKSKFEQHKRKQAELRFPDSKKKAEARSYFDVEKLRRELPAEINEARDQTTRLEERAQTYKTRAQRWEGEYKTMKSRAEKEYAQFGGIEKQQHEKSCAVSKSIAIG